MTFRNKSFIPVILLLFMGVSCKDRNEYRVNDSFSVYLQRFEDEAKKYNRTFDLTTTGLIIEFADLKNNTAGLTHYEDPIRIEIDKTYWNDITGTVGADQMKEDLIFHELGHGLLNRGHLNTTLENGDWKSMMCGGDKIGDRPWNINYKGERKTYYLKELFNESEPVPDFASLQLPVDTAGYSKSVYLDFNTTSKDHAGWDLGETDQYKMGIDNGRLRFQSKVTDVYLVFANLNSPIAINKNFSFELTIEYPAGDSSNQYGIIFGNNPIGPDDTNNSTEYFSINNNQKMYMGNRTWYSFFTELSRPQILVAGRNKLKVFNIGGMLYYFINNVYCYKSEIETKDDINQFGFMVPSNGTVWIEDLSVSQPYGTSQASKVKQNQQLEFNLMTTKSLNQHIINRR